MDIDAFILIGGRSRRFGSDKAEATFEGSPLVTRIAETIQAAIDPVRIILVAADQMQLLRIAGVDLSLPFVFDLYKGRGPLGGLHAAAANAQTEWMLVLGCDLPLISPELVRRLAGRISDDADAVAPVQPDARAQPLCTYYRAKTVAAAAATLLERNRPTPSLLSLLDLVSSTFIPFSEISDLPHAENFFLNANTPEDLLRAADLNAADIKTAQ